MTDIDNEIRMELTMMIVMAGIAMLTKGITENKARERERQNTQHDSQRAGAGAALWTSWGGSETLGPCSPRGRSGSRRCRARAAAPAPSSPACCALTRGWKSGG